MRSWYRFVAQADAPAVDLYIYSDIGQSWWDDTAVSAQQFVADLQALPEAVTTLRVHVNSLGGDVFDAIAIANALRDQRTTKGRTVEVTIDGIAASAASIVIMAGSPIRIGDNAMVMVHNPWAIVMGDAGELRQTADRLDAIRGTIITTYRWRSSLSEDALGALMDAETWMSADDAVTNGFATEKVQGLTVEASLDRRSLAKLTIPEQYRARVSALLTPDPAPPAAAAAADVLRLCREGDCLDLAEGLIAAGAPLERVRATIAETREQRTAQQARATAITALCAAAKLPELAAGYIAGAMSLDAVRGQLTTLTAKLDRAEIDSGLDPTHGTRAKARIDHAAVYAARNRH